jgi:hypothetical protein
VFERPVILQFLIDEVSREVQRHLAQRGQVSLAEKVIRRQRSLVGRIDFTLFEAS